jgi:nucleotide-binding universal stress UspA family protein
MVEIRKILYPCDLTENSTKILPYVLSMSENYNSMIYLIHVVEDFIRWGGWSFEPHPSLNKLQKEAVEYAEKATQKICEEKLQNCPNFQRIVVSGDPATEILKAIEAEGIDLVIMGTHGRKGLEHTIFGSVAENVVKKAHVPVLVINPYRVKKTGG